MIVNEWKPPFHISATSSKNIFLAGSIEMGIADNWQVRLVQALMQEESSDVVDVFNPRRDDWDSSWEQKFDNAQFREQVAWELDALEKAKVIALYFDPSTKSPISLLEFGLYAQTGKLVVCCPEPFWRKGNVDIVCAKYGVQQVDTLDDLVDACVRRLKVF